MKTIAITGASGHLGNNISRYLLTKGYSLKALVRFDDEESLLGLDIELVKGDLFAPDALDRLMQGSDIIIHLAGKVSIYPEEKKEVYKTNIEGVKRVTEACLRNGIKKMIHFSSIHAHKGFGPDVRLDENTPYVESQKSSYDYSKARGENIVIEARKKGLDTVIINPTAVIGPYDFKPSLSGKLLSDIYTGKMNSIVSGGFDWVDVRDLAQAVDKIIEDDIQNEKFVLSGNWASFKEMADLVCGVKGKKYKGFTSSLSMAYLGLPFIKLYSKITGELPLYTIESLKTIKEGSKDVSNKKAAEMLGYKPRPFDQSITEITQWLIGHFNLNDG